MRSPLATPPDPLGAELQRTFISAPADIASRPRASFVAYRKTFTLDAAPRIAPLHLFADARYLLWVNGRPVHRGPNRFDILGPEYDTVDIASSLHPGANTLAARVGHRPIPPGLGMGQQCA